MKKSSIVLLQVVIVLIGICALAFLLWEPHIEGRNATATLSEIYFNDPFLVWAYTASIAFFVALYQTFKILGYVAQDKVFTKATAKALYTIRNCALVIVGFALGAEAYLFIGRPEDDIAGGVFMGLLIIFGSGVVAIVAKMFEGIVQNADGKKSVND